MTKTFFFAKGKNCEKNRELFFRNGLFIDYKCIMVIYI